MIDSARTAGDTLGGVFTVIAEGVPPGLGSYRQWDTRLDGLLKPFLKLANRIRIEILTAQTCQSVFSTKISNRHNYDCAGIIPCWRA